MFNDWKCRATGDGSGDGNLGMTMAMWKRNIDDY